MERAENLGFRVQVLRRCQILLHSESLCASIKVDEEEAGDVLFGHPIRPLFLGPQKMKGQKAESSPTGYEN